MVRTRLRACLQVCTPVLSNRLQMGTCVLPKVNAVHIMVYLAGNGADVEAFDMWQPQPAMPQASHVGAGFASISSAFQRLRQQRQPEQQRPPPAALFSVAK